MVKPKHGIVAALDIGSTKIICFIARLGLNGQVEVTGIGHQVARGISAGMITDVRAAERSIVAAIDAAEQMAGETVDRVIVNISASKLLSSHRQVEIDMHGNQVEERDLTKLLSMGFNKSLKEGRNVIHCIPMLYYTDELPTVQDPRDMAVNRLGVELHVVTAASMAIRNMVNCLARCHLDMVDMVVSSYASGLSCLHEDELQLGTFLLDMGGGNTAISVFKGGRLVHTETIPLGGIHVTSDMARGLSIPLAAAERLKTLHGSVVLSETGEHDTIDVLLGDEDDQDFVTISRHELQSIIRPRIEEILELIKGRLAKVGFSFMESDLCVLTGGASQLIGMKDITEELFKCQVRLGTPTPLAGQAESTKGAAFATVTGILRYAVSKLEEAEPLKPKRGIKFRKVMPRMFDWIKENF